MQEASQREMISKVRGLFKLQASDTYQNLPDRAILSELQSTSIKFIKQATDKRTLWNSGNIFTPIPCLKLKQVPLADCCDYQSDCTIARSIVQLPKVAEGTKFGMLMYLYSIDGVSRKFIESTPDRYANSLKLGLKTNQIHWWIQNKYLYVGDNKIEKVKPVAKFEEDIPQSLISYPGYCGETETTLTKGCCPASDEITNTAAQDRSLCCPVNPYDQPFMTPSYIVDDIIKEVSNKLLSTYKRSQDDKTNDMKDDTK